MKVGLAYVETRAHGCSATFQIYDHWNCDRKLQPFYELELTPSEIEYLISSLAEALIKIEGHVLEQRRLALASLQRGAS